MSQIAAGQMINSPCLDRGSDLAISLEMDTYTTRTDQITDEQIVDIGYHYPVINKADINGDGKINLIDFGILASQWMQVPSVPSADIFPAGGDNLVDSGDLEELCQNWLEGI